VTAAILRKAKRRNAVEPVIGRMKSDGRMARNSLKDADGDAINALLCGAGHNLRKILSCSSFVPCGGSRCVVSRTPCKHETPISRYLSPESEFLMDN
jgi:hypothetical protein